MKPLILDAQDETTGANLESFCLVKTCPSTQSPVCVLRHSITRRLNGRVLLVSPSLPTEQLWILSNRYMHVHTVKFLSLIICQQGQPSSCGYRTPAPRPAATAPRPAATAPRLAATALRSSGPAARRQLMATARSCFARWAMRGATPGRAAWPAGSPWRTWRTRGAS